MSAPRDVLVLFDIDGTLLEPSVTHDRAVEVACREVYGIDVAVPSEVDAPKYDGVTTPMLVRSVLRDAGLAEPLREAGWHRMPRAMREAYATLQRGLPQPSFADACRALDHLTAAGYAVGLLTGNYQAVARLKLTAAGLWRPELAHGHGAFGDDADDRDELGRIAAGRARAAGFARWVIVGDTVRDISCARAAGALAVAVTTGTAGRDELRAADVVCASLTDAVDAIVARVSVNPQTRR